MNIKKIWNDVLNLHVTYDISFLQGVAQYII